MRRRAVAACRRGERPAARQAASTASRSLVSEPVCERAARTAAAVRPTVSSTTGLPAVRAASANARPSRKSSQYTPITRVPSCAARFATTLGHVEVGLVADRNEPREAEAEVAEQEPGLERDVPALRDEADRPRRQRVRREVELGGRVEDARGSSGRRARRRQRGHARRSPARARRPPGPSSPSPAAIATSAFAPAASDSSTACSSACAGTLSTTSSGASGSSAIDAVHRQPVQLAAAAADEVHPSAVRALGRVAREPVAPLCRDRPRRRRSRATGARRAASDRGSSSADRASRTIRAGRARHARRGGAARARARRPPAAAARPLAVSTCSSICSAVASGSASPSRSSTWKRCSRFSSASSTCVVTVTRVAGLELAEVREVRLDREVAAARGEIVGVDPEPRRGARPSRRRRPAGSGSRGRGRCSRSSPPGRIVCSRSPPLGLAGAAGPAVRSSSPRSQRASVSPAPVSCARSACRSATSASSRSRSSSRDRSSGRLRRRTAPPACRSARP